MIAQLHLFACEAMQAVVAVCFICWQIDVGRAYAAASSNLC